MFTKRRVIAVAIIGAVLLGGLVAVGVIGTPAVDDVSNTFGAVSDEETVIETDLVIDNPNPIGITIGSASINYSVAMNEIHMATGGIEGIEVDRGQSTIPANSTMNNSAITGWWLSHVDAGESTDVQIDATLSTERFDREVDYTHTTTVDTDILAGFRSDEPRELNADHALVSDPILYVNETDAEWGEVTETQTPIDKEFLLYNPNTEPYIITQMGYEISMNGVPVGDGETDREVIIEGHSTAELGLETAIDATVLDEWWVSHLDEAVHGHQVSELRIEFSAVVELPDGERIELDLDALTYEDYVGTDIFDEGGDVGVPPDDADDGDEADASTADDEQADTGDDEAPGDEDDGTDDAPDDEDDGDDESDDEEDDGLIGDDDPL